MLTLVSYMQAHDDEQNLHRFYRIEYGQDLFDQWIVEINYGRVGCKGRSLITLFDSQKDSLSYVKQSLKRRQSAHRRIGVNYESVYSGLPFA
ncbi:MAG: WGR domain-containing protein [Methylococcales bacterium]|jgi:predicted DNA-binding WGR domain protein|nr:WGR domain-containing protein [Methylococcales bacterium]